MPGPKLFRTGIPSGRREAQKQHGVTFQQKITP